MFGIVEPQILRAGAVPRRRRPSSSALPTQQADSMLMMHGEGQELQRGVKLLESLTRPQTTSAQFAASDKTWTQTHQRLVGNGFEMLVNKQNLFVPDDNTIDMSSTVYCHLEKQNGGSDGRASALPPQRRSRGVTAKTRLTGGRRPHTSGGNNFADTQRRRMPTRLPVHARTVADVHRRAAVTHAYTTLPPPTAELSVASLRKPHVAEGWFDEDNDPRYQSRAAAADARLTMQAILKNNNNSGNGDAAINGRRLLTAALPAALQHSDDGGGGDANDDVDGDDGDDDATFLTQTDDAIGDDVDDVVMYSIVSHRGSAANATAAAAAAAATAFAASTSARILKRPLLRRLRLAEEEISRLRRVDVEMKTLKATVVTLRAALAARDDDEVVLQARIHKAETQRDDWYALLKL
jgi:hypothetical protein